MRSLRYLPAGKGPRRLPEVTRRSAIVAKAFPAARRTPFGAGRTNISLRPAGAGNGLRVCPAWGMPFRGRTRRFLFNASSRGYFEGASLLRGCRPAVESEPWAIRTGLINAYQRPQPQPPPQPPQRPQPPQQPPQPRPRPPPQPQLHRLHIVLTPSMLYIFDNPQPATRAQRNQG